MTSVLIAVALACQIHSGGRTSTIEKKQLKCQQELLSCMNFISRGELKRCILERKVK